MPSLTIRPIKPSDNQPLATIIRNALTEFKANKPGTVFFDEATDRLSEVFAIEGAAYFVTEEDGNILGGGGVYPTKGLPPNVCELVKLYIKPEARGRGLGETLIKTSIDFAQNNGYQAMYLETLPELTSAIPLYQKMGFELLTQPMGDTGHFGCDIWMLKTLAPLY